MGTAKEKEQIQCTCGHEHARDEKCGAVVSGVPMLQYCQCPGALKHGEQLGKDVA